MRGAVVRRAVLRIGEIVVVFVVLLLLFLFLVTSEHVCSNGTTDKTETTVSEFGTERSSCYTTENCFTQSTFAFYGLPIRT